MIVYTYLYRVINALKLKFNSRQGTQAVCDTASKLFQPIQRDWMADRS